MGASSLLWSAPRYRGDIGETWEISGGRPNPSPNPNPNPISNQVGAYIAAEQHGVVAVVDGSISAVAALCAVRMVPPCRRAMVRVGG